MKKRNPPKFDRCVKSVKRSLKKYKRVGSAYAICKSSRQNPSKWNPILPLDIATLTTVPGVLSAIEGQRQKIERGMKKNVSFRKEKKRMKKEGYTLKKSSRFLAEGKRRLAARMRRKSVTNKGKRNSVPNAEERYQRFHGRPSEQLVKVRTTLHSHDVLAGIGDLRKLRIKSANGHWKVTVKFLKPYPILSMNEAATQLYIEGGDQSVDLGSFGIKTPHEKEVLGQVTDVWYFTRKDHLRPEDGGTAVYHHKFGKVKPTIVYDVPNQLMEFAGGGYTIPDEGIDQ